MKRIFFWTSMVLCAAIGIGITQSLIAFDEFDIGADSDGADKELQDSSESSGRSGGGGFGAGSFGGPGGGTFGNIEPVDPPTASEGIWSLGVGITWSENKDVLHGFSQATGRWATIRIEPPDQVHPMVGVNVAAVFVENGWAAFSGTTCTWDLLKLDESTIDDSSVSNELVTLRTADHVYTFAAALGKWTSPTDSRLNATIPPDVAVSDFETTTQPDHQTDGHTITQLEEAWRHAERKSLDVAEQLQRDSSDATEEALAELREELRHAVESAFSARRMLQSARMNQMRSKLDQISESLQAREQRRDRIIARRVEELQDPGLNWQAFRDTQENAHPAPPTIPQATNTNDLPIPFTRRARNDISAITNTSTPPASFYWDKADDLRGRLLADHRLVFQDRSQTESLAKAINQLRIPWADASAEKRDKVEKHLRSPSGSSGGGFGGTAGQAVGAPIAEKEERYEKLRLERLQVDCQLLELHLNSFVNALDSLTRHWERYQSTVGELKLGVREAILVFQAAEQIDAIQRQKQKLGVGDRAVGINTRVALGRAQINVERAAGHLERAKQISKENPQVEPTQYREDLQKSQKLLEQVLEETPEIFLEPAADGTGMGMF